MVDPASFPNRLIRVPTIKISLSLTRWVADGLLHENVPPDFLYASGRPNRFNVAGAGCLYVSGEEETAKAEYEANLPADDHQQPVTMFWIHAKLAKVIDLTEPGTLAHLGLTANDLQQPWRFVSRPTATQILGSAVAANTSGIAAIRYPSEAMRLTGRTGTNFAIFRDRVVAPDSLTIKGPGNTILQRWP